MYARLLFACVATALPLSAQALTWVEGSTRTDLSVRTVSEAAPTSAPSTVLSRVELLPIEITNRTLQQSLRDDVARLVERQGVRRVELDGNGSLFAYRRAGGSVWGFLWVRDDGTPVVVLEEPAAGGGSPFEDRLGVAPDGRHAVVPRIDGSLHVVRLDGQTYASTATRSRHVPVPAFVDPVSVTVGRRVAWFATEDDRAWRLSLADAATPVDVTPPGARSDRVKEEFAPSADGRFVVFLHGPQHQFSLFLLGETGPAVRLPKPAAKYEEPGYLPEEPNGPELMLNDDATSLLYNDSTVRDELFVMDVSGVLPTTHWTGDPIFQPYIGGIILPVAIGGVMVAGIGDPGRFDLHSASAGVATSTNLTRTCNATLPPWDEGSLIPVANTVTANGVLLSALAPSAGGPPVLTRFGGGGPTAVVRALRAPIRRGTSLVPARPADYLAPSTQGDVLVDGATGLPGLAAPAGVRLTTPVGGAGFRVFLATAGTLRAAVVDIDGGPLIPVPGTTLDDVLLTAGGGILLDDTASGLTLLDTNGLHHVQAGAANRVVLSGAGTADA